MDYTIQGGELPVLNVVLNKGEKIITQAGGMSWMSNDIKMETVAGGLGKAIGRMFMGETMFLNHYTAQKDDSKISIASSFPGSIIAIDIDHNHSFIAQKRAYLASTKGVELSIFLNKKLGTGLFGGEGFIMQKLSGEGKAFIEIDGSCIIKQLDDYEVIVVSTGHDAGMESTVKSDIKSVGGAKNIFFGGEGFFHTILTGPGKVYLLTMPSFNLLGQFRP